MIQNVQIGQLQHYLLLPVYELAASTHMFRKSLNKHFGYQHR